MKKSLLAILVLCMSAVAFGSAQANDKVLRIITWTGYAPPELIEKFKRTIRRY